jgi:hypothetical protein
MTEVVAGWKEIWKPGSREIGVGSGPDLFSLVWVPSLIYPRLDCCGFAAPRIRGKVPMGHMEKPNVRGPSPSYKAHLALREKLNRPHKPPPLLRTPINSRGRKRHR